MLALASLTALIIALAIGGAIEIRNATDEGCP